MTLLEALKDTRDNGPNRVGPGTPPGICSALRRRGVSTQDRRAFVYWTLLWPENSGDFAFPVPSPKEEAPADYYFWAEEEGVSWDRSHPYGAARWDLLEWCIQQLEKETGHAQD